VAGLPDPDPDAKRLERKPLLLVGQLSETRRDSLAPALEVRQPALTILPAGASRQHGDALDLEGSLPSA
jgi:hypothetical protein